MTRKKGILKQVVLHATGIGTELLYSIVLAAVAFIISALALRWF